MKDEAERLCQLSVIDRTFWEKEGVTLAGMDEVGRGPLAGPVVAACAVMPAKPLVQYVDDSKRLSPKKRAAVYQELIKAALSYGLGWVDAAVIDEIGIVPAVRRAFEQAFYAVKLPVTDVLVDAMKGIDIPARQYPYIKGDRLSYSIAASSIIAKVERDAYMESMHEKYPQYGFNKHKGYGTAAHIAALRAHGPCGLHRRSFIRNFSG